MFADFAGMVEPVDAICIPVEIWFTRKDGKQGEVSNDSFYLSCIDKNHCYLFSNETFRRTTWKGVKATYMNKKNKIVTNTRLTLKQLNSLLDNDDFNLTAIVLMQTENSSINLSDIHFFSDTDDEIYYAYDNDSYHRIYRTQEERYEEMKKALEAMHAKWRA